MHGWGDVCRTWMRGYLQECWWWVIYWDAHLTIGYPTEENVSPFSSNYYLPTDHHTGVGPHDLPCFLHNGMLTCPISCLSFVGYHSYWWFKSVFAFKQLIQELQESWDVLPLVFAHTGWAFLLSFYSPSLILHWAPGLPSSYLLCTCSH